MELKTYFAQDPEGNVMASPIAALYLPDGQTLATGLRNAAGEPLGNPFNGAPDGRITIAAPDGDYILRVTGGAREIDLPLRFIDAGELLDQITGLAAPGTFPHVRAGGQWVALPYLVPFGFGELAAAPLLIHAFAERVRFPADFAGSAAYVGTAPAEAASLPIMRGADPIGAIEISSAGAVSFSTAAGAAIVFEPGEALIIPALDPLPSGLKNSAFTLAGIRG